MINKHPKILATILIIFGAVLLIAGLLRDEAAAVFNKASRICLECIGIG